LGAGKTTCVRGLLRALGVAGAVRSPTYTLLEIYPLAERTCVHVDLYRVQRPGEVDELGLRDLLDPEHLLLIEWPEKGGVAVPRADLVLTLEYDDAGRRATLLAAGEIGRDWLHELGQDSRLMPYVSNLT
jgi:tRNA threonylcarbamoyladenosine biosynthesis protein TsaE